MNTNQSCVAPCETLDAEVKARIPREHKSKLQSLAFLRHLKVSDIIREAIRVELAGAERKVFP